jgi:hypothetical protein
MNQASNDNQRGYVQAVLVLIYEQREEYRERVFNDKRDLFSVVLWLQDEREAWVYNGPRSNG